MVLLAMLSLFIYFGTLTKTFQIGYKLSKETRIVTICFILPFVKSLAKLLIIYFRLAKNIMNTLQRLLKIQGNIFLDCLFGIKLFSTKSTRICVQKNEGSLVQ